MLVKGDNCCKQTKTHLNHSLSKPPGAEANVFYCAADLQSLLKGHCPLSNLWMT